MNTPEITTASVKIMRSHDYSHFEVSLSSNLLGTKPEEIIAAVDELRKTAARLADKAVRQYRIAKVNAQRLLSEKQSRDYLVGRMHLIENTPEGERTVDEQAQLKAYKDRVWEASRSYDYEDDWQGDDDL